MKRFNWEFIFTIMPSTMVVIILFLFIINSPITDPSCSDDLDQEETGVTWIDDSAYFIEAKLLESSKHYHFFIARNGFTYQASRENFIEEYTNDHFYLLTIDSSGTPKDKSDDVVLTIWEHK